MEESAKGVITDAGVLEILAAEGIYRHYYFWRVVFLPITRKLVKMDDIFYWATYFIT